MYTKGFTVVEILVVIIIIAVLSAVGAVSYNGMQRRTATNTMLNDLNNASTELERYALANNGNFPDTSYLINKLSTSNNVSLVVYSNSSNSSTGPIYTGLSPVQYGVLFQEICEEAIANPALTTIHSSDGAQTDNVQHRCDDNIAAGHLQITGWDTQTWNTPLERSTLQTYVDNIPADSWWTDKQNVMRSFYQYLIDTYEARGGVWPITSFWDPWANQWSGVPREDLPSLEGLGNSDLQEDSYCVQAYHSDFPELSYRITSDKLSPEQGSCSEA